ncbi:MAG: hypothetical protein R3B09_27260 [Nannocystaceae bacterium]
MAPPRAPGLAIQSDDPRENGPLTVTLEAADVPTPTGVLDPG